MLLSLQNYNKKTNAELDLLISRGTGEVACVHSSILWPPEDTEPMVQGFEFD